MEIITHVFNQQYQPQKALLFYGLVSTDSQRSEDSSVYVESYDIGKCGQPINAHPLTVKEMIQLSSVLQSATELHTGYLVPKALMPASVLHINPQGSGNVIWHTPAMQVHLLFANALGIPSGKAAVPALIWKASRNDLHLYALKGGRKPTLQTSLYHAPFFNIHANGNVCMGTVNIDFSSQPGLEDFTRQWEDYFWNSYFSHLIGTSSPVTGNIVQLWQHLIATGEDFPVNVLKKTSLQLQNLLP